jgi:hypothetical protein
MKAYTPREKESLPPPHIDIYRISKNKKKKVEATAKEKKKPRRSIFILHVLDRGVNGGTQ